MKKIVFLLTLLAFIFTGCPKVTDEEREVVIYFTSKSFSNPVLLPIATNTENAIQKIILFGVDDQNNIKIFPVITDLSSSGVILSISKKIKSFYAIANPSSDIESANLSNASALIDIISDFSNAPDSPFLMSGKADINIIDDSITIELVKAVAKIRISSGNDFKISSVTVMNTSAKGYVFPKTPFSVPDKKINYPEITASTPTFYVAENTTVSPTKFVVNGQFMGQQVSYTIEQLTSNGEPVNIVRNHYYEVTITPSEYDCSITLSILDWIDVPVDNHIIPDENFQ